jgi:uncharacterized protein (TIGR00251 family)
MCPDDAAIRAVPGGVLLAVRVIPRASRTTLAGTRGEAILIRLAAPPVEDAANEALIDFLASLLDVPRRNITIQSGSHSRTKQVRVTRIDAAAAAQRLGLPA